MFRGTYPDLLSAYSHMVIWLHTTASTSIDSKQPAPRIKGHNAAYMVRLEIQVNCTKYCVLVNWNGGGRGSATHVSTVKRREILLESVKAQTPRNDRPILFAYIRRNSNVIADLLITNKKGNVEIPFIVNLRVSYRSGTTDTAGHIERGTTCLLTLSHPLPVPIDWGSQPPQRRIASRRTDELPFSTEALFRSHTQDQ